MILIAVLLGLLFFAAMRIGPWIAGMVFTPGGILGAVELTGHQINNAAVHEGAVWYAETEGVWRKGVRTRLLRLPLEEGSAPQQVAEIDVAAPLLLGGEEHLWVVASGGRVWKYAQGALTPVVEKDSLNLSSRPFLWNGKPAVIEQQAQGHCLRVLEEGRWEQVATFRILLHGALREFHGEDIAAFQHNGDLHVFIKPVLDSLYYHEGVPVEPPPGEEAWTPVVACGGQWKAIVLDGQPVVYVHGRKDGQASLLGFRETGDGWEEFFSLPISLDVGLGVCATGRAGEVVLLRRILPLGTEVLLVREGEAVSRWRTDGTVGLNEAYRRYSWAPRVVRPAMALLAALCFSLAMRCNKLRSLDTPMGKVRFASPLRRGVALGVDAVVFAAPLGAYLLWRMGGALAAPLDFDSLWALAIQTVLVTVVWLILAPLAFILMEAYWGWTPGKWLLGLRVLRPDLRRCGFVRSLARNLLRVIDGMSWHLVGMVIAALTAKWQRLGDLAVDAVVVRRPE